MGQVWIGVADALDDRQLIVVPHPLEFGQLGMETAIRGQSEGVRPGDGERAVHVVVGAVVERHHRVEPVVAPEHPDHDEDAVRRPDRTGRPCGGVVAQRELVEQRPAGAGNQTGADAHPDELEKPPSIDRVGVVGDRRAQVTQGVASGDVGVQHGQARWKSGATRIRARSSERSHRFELTEKSDQRLAHRRLGVELHELEEPIDEIPGTVAVGVLDLPTRQGAPGEVDEAVAVPVGPASTST